MDRKEVGSLLVRRSVERVASSMQISLSGTWHVQ